MKAMVPWVCGGGLREATSIGHMLPLDVARFLRKPKLNALFGSSLAHYFRVAFARMSSVLWEVPHCPRLEGQPDKLGAKADESIKTLARGDRIYENTLSAVGSPRRAGAIGRYDCGVCQQFNSMWPRACICEPRRTTAAILRHFVTNWSTIG